MQDGTLADGVPEWAVTVRVGNTVRVAESVSIDAELPSDMPDAVGGVSGVSARTGSITWAPQEAVQERPASPWTRADSWPPTPGTSVGIWVGDEGTSWKVFTGVIDSTTGDESGMVSKIIDASDRLNRPISLDPVAHRMPGYYDEATGASNATVVTGVQPWHAAYRALRAGGFGIPAPTQSAGSVVLQVDMQGSIMPDRGYLNYDYESVSLGWGGGWTYLADNLVNYRPLPATLGSSSVLRLWMRWHAGLGEAATLNVAMDDERRYRIAGTLDPSTSMLTLRTRVWDGHPDTGTLLADETVTRAAVVQDGTVWVDVAIPVSGAMRYTVAQTGVPAGSSNGSSSFSVSLGANAGSGSSPVQVSTWGPQVQVRVGVLTLAQWEAMSSHVTASRVHAWGWGLVHYQHTSRAIEGRAAKDVLDEIGAATLTSMWIDETGVMQWAPSNQLYSQAPVKTVTTAQDIFSLGWVESLLSTRHQIRVNYLAGALTLSRRYGVTLYQPSNGATLENGSTIEDFIDVPADEEWFGVDTTVTRIGSEETNIAFSAGHGSFYGGIYDDLAGIQRWALAHAEFSYSMSSLGLRTWLLEQTNTRSDGHDLQLISKDEDAEPSLKKRWRNQPLPIIRGRGRTQFTDATYTASQTGPLTAPDLDFDMGSWGRAADAKRVADWLAARLTTPLITLTDLEIEYDPRLQLGDVITVDSLAFYGFSVDCLIVGKSEQHGNGSHMTLTVRVIRVRSTVTTYAEFEAAYNGRNYAALESAWAGATYSQLEANPLGGS